MLIPSIDIMNGRAVKLLQGEDGERQVVDAGSPIEVAKNLAVLGTISVVDLDSAIGTGNNSELIREIVRDYPCRVGGGIRDVQTAKTWLNDGAVQVVLGNAAVPEILKELPRERVVAALDARETPTGFQTNTGESVTSKIQSLSAHVSGFLVTCIEPDCSAFIHTIDELRKACGDASLTVAGPSLDIEHVGVLDKASTDTSLALAVTLEPGALGRAIFNCAVSDRPDGLIATMVVDEQGVALGLVYSDEQSIAKSFEIRQGVYHSRKRGLWHKGATSGATQDLIKVDLDCDRDAMRFVVRQHGAGFCHLNTRTCFGKDGGLTALMTTLESRKRDAPAGSYTKRLFEDTKLLHSKIIEEAYEVTEAETLEDIAWEAADVLYFTMVKVVKHGLSLADVERQLNRRALKVTRRKGDAKPNTPVTRDQAKQTAHAPAASPSKTTQSATALPKAQSYTPGPVRLTRLQPHQLPSLGDREAVTEETRGQAQSIVSAVANGGIKSVLDFATKFGDLKPGEPYLIRGDELKRAFLNIGADERNLLIRTADRIRKFAEAQRQSITDTQIAIPGGVAGQTVAPVDTAGCYAPGGRYPLPSSVLMTAITARVAGVKNVIVASPRPLELTKAAAYVAGADSLLAVGGAHAIAAMAYGAGDVPPCDAVVGPGNRWVTAAKSIVNGRCAIDMLAGPSEVLVFADRTANPEVIAADLLAQAEHDTDARSILVSLDADLITRVDQELTRQLAELPTRDVAAVAIASSFAVHVPSVEVGIEVCDRLAPEHLEVVMANAEAVGRRLNHYGALFIGNMAAEVLGDYGAGPNHTLPTSGTARYTGGLSVFTFLRVRTWMRIDDPSDAQQLVEDAVTLGLCEGLHGHSRAAAKRRFATLAALNLLPPPQASLTSGINNSASTGRIAFVCEPRSAAYEAVLELLEAAGFDWKTGNDGIIHEEDLNSLRTGHRDAHVIFATPDCVSRSGIRDLLVPVVAIKDGQSNNHTISMWVHKTPGEGFLSRSTSIDTLITMFKAAIAARQACQVEFNLAVPYGSGVQPPVLATLFNDISVLRMPSVTEARAVAPHSNGTTYEIKLTMSRRDLPTLITRLKESGGSNLTVSTLAQLHN